MTISGGPARPEIAPGVPVLRVMSVEVALRFYVSGGGAAAGRRRGRAGRTDDAAHRPVRQPAAFRPAGAELTVSSGCAAGVCAGGSRSPWDHP